MNSELLCLNLRMLFLYSGLTLSTQETPTYLAVP
jgi:hypothetical protein